MHEGKLELIYTDDTKRIKRINNSSLTKILFLLLMFHFMFMPKIYMWTKAGLLISMLFLTLASRRYIITISGNAVILGIYILFNIFNTLFGIIQGYGKAAIRSSSVSIAWPLLFFLFIGISINREWFLYFYRILIGLTLSLCIFDTLVLFSGLWGLFGLRGFLMIFNKNQVIGSNWSGFYAIRSDHIFLYAFLIPFMMSVMFRQTNVEYIELGVSKGYVRFVCLNAILIGVLSGMGGVWLAEAVAFVICLFRYRDMRGKRVASIIFAAGIVLTMVFLSYSSKGVAWYIYEEVADHLFVKSRGIEDIRGNQIKAMIDLWMTSPLVGAGRGVPVGYWREGRDVLGVGGESSYFVMLYQSGVIGVALFFALVVNGIKTLKTRDDAPWFCDPFIVGMVCFLIANAFNPYLANLSVIWILLFPLIVNKPRYR